MSRVERALGRLQSEARRRRVEHFVHILPAQEGRFRPLPERLPAALQEGLGAQGIQQLYAHQAEAYERLREGEHCVVATPSASGKTLCYLLPILQTLQEDPEARALLLFPTKALARDQEAIIRRYAEVLEMDLGGQVYDGDTPPDRRQKIRQGARIVITNPDMLHQGILPHHTLWIRLFRNLRFVVVDEMHVYRGVFGSHFANVLRRLKRVAAHYGSRPVFFFSSATIGNPGELAESLLEEKVSVITESGAPTGRRFVLLWNPPVVDRLLHLRRNYLLETEWLLRILQEEGLQTLAFARSRLNVEVLVSTLRKRLSDAPARAAGIRGYRGGYLPKERREIERDLRDGRASLVVATNALELGIDIGQLEGVVIAGYPGTIASTWQQWARAGRRKEDALFVLVHSSAPLDQYLFHHPEYLLRGSPENAFVAPDNPIILSAHLKCALFELPLKEGERFSDSEWLPELLREMEEAGVVHRSQGAWHWVGTEYPADSISLRTIPGENVVITDISGETPRTLGEVDEYSAPLLVHKHAIYIHEGETYEVEELDWEARVARVRKKEVDYFTDALDYTRLRVLHEVRSTGPPLHGTLGEVEVVRKVAGFKKVRFGTMENVGYGQVDLPQWRLPTTAFWIPLRREWLRTVSSSLEEQISALLGLRYAVGAVAPLYLMCDQRDIGVHIGDRQAEWGIPAWVPTSLDELLEALSGGAETVLFVYDAVPGGVGLAEHLFELFPLILRSALENITECACRQGCPSCVGPPVPGVPPAKELTRRLLEILRELL